LGAVRANPEVGIGLMDACRLMQRDPFAIAAAEGKSTRVGGRGRLGPCLMVRRGLLSHTLSSQRRRNQRMQRVVLHGFLCVALALLVATQYWSARSDQAASLAQTQANALNLATSLAQHAGDTFQIADTALSGIDARLEESHRIDVDSLHRFLASEVARSDRIHGLFVYDARGEWVTSSLASMPALHNNSDREYFKYHRANRDQLARINAPVQSRSDGSWIVTLTRRVNLPDGSFGGVVLASIQLAYFENFYGTFDVGRDGTIGMTMDDGTVIVRLPHDDGPRSKSIAGTHLFHQLQARRRGALTYTSPIDGVTRISGFARVSGFPVNLLAGVSEVESMAAWRSSVRSRLAITVLGVSILLIAALWLDIQLRRTHRSELAFSEQASLDGLTGIYNRRTFDLQLDRAIVAGQIQDSALSLILVDVDHFKLFNDTYGHSEGDACLRLVARTLSSKTRGDDAVARFGGEEFTLILAGCGAEDADRQGRRIVDEIQALQIPHASSPTAGHVTISAGVVTWEGPGRASGAALIAAADRALYEAKRAGRNRHCARTL
jgi:diguanylate cyclase (GGDEF)-like protein